jgi:hypothetical protein
MSKITMAKVRSPGAEAGAEAGYVKIAMAIEIVFF